MHIPLDRRNVPPHTWAVVSERSAKSRVTRRVGIKDVAAAVGLGKTTVSDILHREVGGKYPAETRERVLEAVRRLGYSPASSAQQMRRGRSRVVGLLLTQDFTNPFWARLTHFTERALRDRGYRLQLAIADSDAVTELDAVRQLASDRVEGLIIGPFAQQTDFEPLRAFLGRAPVVMYGMQVAGFDAVRLDLRAAGRLIVDHLWDRGHRRIGSLGVPDMDLEIETDTKFASVRDELRRRDAYRSEWVVRLPDYGRFEDGRAAATQFAQRWLAMLPHDRPTAMVAHNDQVAMTALASFHALGVRVPNDLSIVGYDNLPESAHFIPALTTVDPHVDQQMTRAVDLIFERLKHPGREPHVELVEPSLVSRASVSSVT